MVCSSHSLSLSLVLIPFLSSLKKVLYLFLSRVECLERFSNLFSVLRISVGIRPLLCALDEGGEWLRPILLSTLADILERKDSLSSFLEWRSSSRKQTSVSLLIELWTEYARLRRELISYLKAHRKQQLKDSSESLTAEEVNEFREDLKVDERMYSTEDENTDSDIEDEPLGRFAMSLQDGNLALASFHTGRSSGGDLVKLWAMSVNLKVLYIAFLWTILPWFGCSFFQTNGLKYPCFEDFFFYFLFRS